MDVMGRLIFVAGPSGSGKDSLLSYALAHQQPGDAFLVAHRYITRPRGEGGENHVAVSERVYGLMRDRGCFALHWRSHGSGYGVGREIDLWMDQGLTVAMNGSRAHLEQAAQRYEDLVPVLIRVDEEILLKRLRQRGRETDEEIRDRIERSSRLEVDHPRLCIIDNSGDLHRAGQELLRIIRSA
ncbi:MAG: phosphonate metabolism protein/1,5-bisphosphokinase (PRPP-forming) PhnN [Desulfovibrionales bacterium]